MTLAKVLGPDGEVWATAPDETWLLRGGDSWPDPYVMVEMCFAGRKQWGTDGQYEYARGRLKHRGPDGMSSWQNEAGHDIVFNPDFWRAVPQEGESR